MKIIVAMLAGLMFTPLAQSSDIENGEQLHNERCVRCHGTGVYTRENRRIDSLDKLGAQVRFCKNQTGVMWFDDEVEDVIHYLNKTFYRF